jgi:hypothetical protein
MRHFALGLRILAALAVAGALARSLAFVPRHEFRPAMSVWRSV